MIHGHGLDSLSLEQELDSLYSYTREFPLETRSAAHHILNVREERLDPFLLAWVYEIPGDTYYITSDYNSAIYYLVESRGLMEVMGDSIKLAHNYNMLADIYREMGMYKEATRQNMHAQEIFSILGDEYV